ncbi:ribonuclease H-like domain-containing protein [Tanacetum coccineum]|uniref:Ribonuclease H-like domain-containing protein n=1 Tax=Tanacetum coccineum TaxID=301880 RepID=A0ABQ5DMK5_9ASTR
MYVHNSVYDSVHNSDDDEADLNPAGTENYNVWSCAMLLALEGRNKTGFIDNTCRRSHTDGVLERQWDRLRSNILSRDPLLDAKGAYVLISSEKSHRAVVIGSGAVSSQRTQSSVFNANVNNKGGTQRFALEQAGIIFDSRANQHLTYTDKNLVNVIDISYIRIKVSHPNGTEALITTVENLVLTNFLTLYDILVVPEYYVTLVSVHKVARDNKFIVEFDESKCFFMSQDLKDVKIMSIGKQVGGLYYFDSIRVLAELVHLDLWRPYKVVSKEGNRLPSSVLKGKSPYQLVFNKKPSLNHLRVFGCLCFATILNNHDKFGNRAEKYVLVGYYSFKKSQDLDHVNFFDEIVYEGPGSNSSASENEMAATYKHDSALFEGGDVNILDTEHVQNDVNQPLRNQSKSDYSLFTKNNKNGFLALLVYVDGIIVTGIVNIDNGICLSQRKYYLDLLSDFGLLACKPTVIPLEQNISISNEPSDTDPIIDNISEYQKLIGKLIYLTHTRPDIAYSFHCLSQFMHKLLKSHLKIALKVLSQAAIKILANHVFHERTKHLEIDLHFVRYKIIYCVIETKKISSSEQTADVLTKGLDKIQHEN